MTDVTNGNAAAKKIRTTTTRAPGLLLSYRTEAAIAAAIVALMLAVGMFVPAALSMGNMQIIIQAAAPLIIMS
ncbi:ABC transporter permease, partial [Mesorhizobium sp. M00.F.Ca.ET.217.01.1.1]